MYTSVSNGTMHKQTHSQHVNNNNTHSISDMYPFPKNSRIRPTLSIIAHCTQSCDYSTGKGWSLRCYTPLELCETLPIYTVVTGSSSSSIATTSDAPFNESTEPTSSNNTIHYIRRLNKGCPVTEQRRA